MPKPLRERSLLSAKRAAGAIFAAIALLSAVTQLRPTVTAAYDSLTAPSQSPTERELAAARDFSAFSLADFLLAARRTIPRGAVYSVVVGDMPLTQPILHEAIPPLLAYWLLPSRYTRDLRSAQWVVTYRMSSEALGVPIAREIGLGPDGNAVEVAR
jgi:hypothetical protein